MNQELLHSLEVYKTIVRYYPIGIDYSSPLYSVYDGIQTIRNIVMNKFESPLYYKWEALINEIQRELAITIGIKIESCHGSEEPCYYGALTLYETEGDIVISRKLYFYISLLAPYYSLLGLDQVIMYWEDQKGGNRIKGETPFTLFEPVAYISPFGIYEKYFSMIRTKIEALFEDYSMIRFITLKTEIPGLSLPYFNEVSKQNPTVSPHYLVQEKFHTIER